MRALDAATLRGDRNDLEHRLAVAPDAESVVMACIEDTTEFRCLEHEWQGLHRDCANLTPFNTWEWLYSWWQAYSTSKQLRLLTWRLNGALVGVAPLYMSTEKTAIGSRTRVLRLVGDSPDSDYLDVLIRRDVVEPVGLQFGIWLARNRSWDAFVLHELPETSVLPHLLKEVSESHRFHLRAQHRMCGVLELPRSFETFLSARQPRFRTKLRSLLKKLDGGGLAFETDSDPAKLGRRLRSLFDLHQRRWTQAGEQGVFGDPARRAFYRHFVTRFARNGWLRLFSIRDGETYRAHQLCFGGRGVTYLLQEGFDLSSSSASYGQMLRAAVMRYLIQRGESHYDFLGGLSKHKEDWGATEGKTIHMIVARPGLRGMLYFGLPFLRERTAVVLKRVLPSTLVRLLETLRSRLVPR